MTDRFQQFVGGQRGPQLVKDGEPQDDPAQPDGYQAARRIRSFHFADVVFRSHTGAAQAFPWVQLRGWLRDETGRRMTFVWPEAVVKLTGRHLDQLEEDVMRRILAELRQIAPAHADKLPAETPVIVGMEIMTLEVAASLDG